MRLEVYMVIVLGAVFALLVGGMSLGFARPRFWALRFFRRHRKDLPTCAWCGDQLGGGPNRWYSLGTGRETCVGCTFPNVDNSNWFHEPFPSTSSARKA